MNGSLLYRLTVTLLEDLHSGTGTGSSVIDAVQARDRQLRPVIRATHLKGLLLEKAREWIEMAEDANELQTRRQRVERLFGTAGAGNRGALMFRSLYRADKRPIDYLLWTSTARRSFSRTPLEDTLRTVEHVPAGTLFEGELLLRDPRLRDLLDQLLRRLDSLGSQRRRGVGQVQMDWPRQPRPVAEAMKERNDRQPFAIPSPPDNQTRAHLRLILRNLDPLCLPTTGHPGNIIGSECYVRGQALAGALADWALRGDHRGTGCKALFDRRVSVGNGLPLPNRIEPKECPSNWDVVPIPLSIRTPKSRGQTSEDWPWWAEEDGGEKRLGQRGEEDELYPRQRTAEEKLTQEKPKRPKDHEFLGSVPILLVVASILLVVQ